MIANHEPAGPIILARGLLQGDPLSPYLLIICDEGLSTLILKAEQRGDLHGIKIFKRAPIISHLLFCDDGFLFFRANEKEVLVMMSILEDYEKASGHAVNLSKSELFFNRYVLDPLWSNPINMLGVHVCLGNGMYLGLPSMIGRRKKATFIYIKDRVWNIINSWSGMSLSRGGCEVLIK